jgi:hypothetical protein
MTSKTEPILSRDQILKIVRKTLKENNDRDKLSSESFMKLVAALEEAWLEKVCGEPVFTVQRGDLGTWLRWNQDPTKLPAGTELFALTRSKP